jgi:methionyl-tRNA formyltransferase
LRILFAGTPQFAGRHLQALIDSGLEIVAVITQPDKPGKRGKKLIPGAVKIIGEAAGLPILQPAKLRLTDLEGLSCDVMVVVAFGQILKPDVLAHPRLGCINVHASILPRWRGAAPIQRAILAGDHQTGITLIQMDAGLDTGDMLARDPVNIGDKDTAGTILAKLGERGPPILIETLAQLEAGTITPASQDNDDSCYAHKIEKNEAQIDWTSVADDVDRVVRAFNPDPIAYCFLGDRRIKIHSGCRVTETGPPSEIIRIGKDGVLVGCGKDSYLIEQIQLPVGKGSILNGQDILNGWTDMLKPGFTFGLHS